MQKITEDITLNKFCIIGTGFSGACLFIHFVKSLMKEKNININMSCAITLIEKRETNGHGYPYDQSALLTDHLCNNPANSMSLWDNDFVDWMTANKNDLIQKYPHLISANHPDQNLQDFPNPNGFYPRALFGVYLNTRFNEYVVLAKKNKIKVEILNSYEAIDGYEDKGLYNVVIEECKSGKQKVLKNFSKVLLSIGHWTNSSNGNVNTLFANPYPYQSIRSRIQLMNSSGKIPNVLVRGMGPSGVDSILTLFSEGQFKTQNSQIHEYIEPITKIQFKTTVVSRSGFFPAVRGEKANYIFKYFTQETFVELEASLNKKLNLEDILELVDLEIKHATQGQISFSDICNLSFKNAYEKLVYDLELENQKLNNLINTIILKVRRMKFYRHLSGMDKKIYDKNYDHVFIRIAVPIPKENALKLRCLFQKGLLHTVKVGYENNQIFQEDEKVILVTQEGEKYSFDLVINTISQNFDVYQHPAKIIQSLLDKNSILPNIESGYNTGGLMLDGYETYKLMQEQQGTVEPSPHLYGFGVLTRYWQNERNFSKAIVDATESVVADWMVYLMDCHNKQAFTMKQLYQVS